MPSRARKASLASSFFVLTLVACAGNSGSGGARAPATPVTENADAGASAAAADAPPAPPTTTTNLPDAGEGTKLTPQSPSAAAEDAGAAPLHASEPGRSAKDIQTVVMTHRDEARACYDRALDAHPGLEGNLVVKWVIDPVGVVKDVGIDDAKSDIHDSTVSACVASVIQKLRFSVSGKGLETRTHYPFNFHPRAPAKPAAK